MTPDSGLVEKIARAIRDIGPHNYDQMAVAEMAASVITQMLREPSDGVFMLVANIVDSAEYTNIADSAEYNLDKPDRILRALADYLEKEEAK